MVYDSKLAFFDKGENISDTRTFLDIKKDYDFVCKSLHIFVEGDDDIEFYRKSIEKIYDGFITKFYVKDGKKNVIDSYKTLDWQQYNKSRILFFVDKDYEDLLGITSKLDRNIFVTKYYSVENYLSSTKTFKYVLEKIFKIESTVIVSRLISTFENSFVIFQKHIIFITAIILEFRKNNKHFDLDQLKMDDFFKMKKLEISKLKYRRENVYLNIKRSNCSSDEKAVIKKTKDIEQIKSCIINDQHLIQYRKILENVRIMNKLSDGKYYIRGKYHLWFFIKSLKDVLNMSDKINDEITKSNHNNSSEFKKINCQINLDEGNIFDILPMKIDTHHDVNLFLIQNIQRING